MNTTDDQPPPVDLPSGNLKEVIKKLQNKHELLEYVEQLTAFNAHHLLDVTEELRERLLLQGLDENDLREVHEYLKVTFDGDLMKSEDRKLTQKRARDLTGFLNN
ncbi:hypothetical protein ACFLZH_05135 [Patescibacteria group bacterium]